MTIVRTYPIVFHLGTAILGDAGDNFLLLWNFWWMRQALGAAHLSFFHSPSLFAPYAFDLVNQPHPARQAGFAATVPGAAPLIVSLNVVLLSVFLTGICSYLLADDITRDARAMVAGARGQMPVRFRLEGTRLLSREWLARRNV
jgi:hypothetical protein